MKLFNQVVKNEKDESKGKARVVRGGRDFALVFLLAWQQIELLQKIPYFLVCVFASWVCLADSSCGCLSFVRWFPSNDVLAVGQQ